MNVAVYNWSLPWPPGELLDHLRALYGLLLLGQIALSLPQARRFFLSERWGGYGQSSPLVDVVGNPVVCALILLGWFVAAVGIGLGCFTLAAALFNLLVCRYFFLQLRWRSLLRGLGAPGFMTWWLARAFFFLELTTSYFPQLQPLVLLVLRVDFACIMLTAGLYKLTAGYFRNEGMQYGLVNPQWSRWPAVWRSLSPDHWCFRLSNHLAWSGELAVGVLLLLPGWRWLGAAIVVLSFGYIACAIRLQFLPVMVILAGLLCAVPEVDSSLPTVATGPASLGEVFLAAGLWGYLVLLPLAYAGLLVNFYGRRPLPGRMQLILEAYTNWWGLHLWRVFSADHTCFFIRIFRQREADDERVLLSCWGRAGTRFAHVGEAIVLTTLFMSLKYQPGNSLGFRDKLLRYARTLPCPVGDLLVFQHVRIMRHCDCFEYVPSAEFLVDPTLGEVCEQTVDDGDPRALLPVSPIHEAARPGSYAPARA